MTENERKELAELLYPNLKHDIAYYESEHIIGTQMDIFEKIGYADASELIRIIRKIAD